MTSTCEASVSPGLQPGQFGRPCGKPTEVRIEFGCVHEHIRSMEACPRHAEQLGIRGRMACSACWTAGHNCPVIGRVVAPGGAR